MSEILNEYNNLTVVFYVKNISNLFYVKVIFVDFWNSKKNNLFYSVEDNAFFLVGNKSMEPGVTHIG